MPLTIIRQSITEVEADAIVNTANPQPTVGGGTDTAVYEAAGWDELLEERRRIGEIRVGDAAATGAYRLPYKIIIHTVSPIWTDGMHGETEALRSCYIRSLEIAREHQCASVAFPLLASGSNGFPKDIALKTALDAIQSYLLEHEMQVILAVFDKQSFELSSNVYAEVKSYIEEHQVEDLSEKEYRHSRREGFAGLVSGRDRRKSDAYAEELYCDADYSTSNFALPKLSEMESYSRILRDGVREETFQVKLLNLIDASGETDPMVYKRANVDRKLFAKIRKDENYKPSRKTAIAFAIALKLSLPEAQDLVNRAGYSISQSTTFDLIIRYCLEHGVYNINDVNSILFEFDQELL